MRHMTGGVQVPPVYWIESSSKNNQFEVLAANKPSIGETARFYDS